MKHLTCVIVVREILSGSLNKYFQICGDDIYCIKPCNELGHLTHNTVDLIIYSVKILGLMNTFVDHQNICKQT